MTTTFRLPHYLCVALGVAIASSFPSTTSATLVFEANFDSPDYADGDLPGQQGWTGGFTPPAIETVRVESGTAISPPSPPPGGNKFAFHAFPTQTAPFWGAWQGRVTVGFSGGNFAGVSFFNGGTEETYIGSAGFPGSIWGIGHDAMAAVQIPGTASEVSTQVVNYVDVPNQTHYVWFNPAEGTDFTCPFGKAA